MTGKSPTLAISNQTDDSKEFPISGSSCSCRIFTSVEQLPMDWDIAQPPQNINLHRPLLTAIEEAPPLGIKPCYIIFYQERKPIGVAYCQITKFNTDQTVQDKEGNSEKPAILKSITSSVKGFLAKKFEFNLLVCGNLLFTGEHGFYFDPSVISRKKSIELIEDALFQVQSFWKERDLNIDGIFIKDLEEKPSNNGQYDFKKNLTDLKYREFLFHPNMILPLRRHWHSFDDYMADISSKYKVRARKAFKCGEAIEKFELSLEDLHKNVDRLYQLYKGVMLTAGFNMVVLHENYIVKLKEHLGDAFIVTGYYIKGDLIGYRTNISNGSELEAHFLGYDQQCNKDYQLYMNMLLDSLKHGIELNAKRIVYARTAMEIKSTIGAIPEDLYCYIRANNSLMNSIMAPILEYFRPDDNWVQRHPFKESSN